MFRNEGAHLSSELINEAVAVTRWYWPDVPALGMVTFVDTRHTKSPNPGYCYQRAGWRKVGQTKGGLYALQLLPEAMPAAQAPVREMEHYLDELAREYFQRCDAYDARICTAVSPRTGEPIPANSQEAALINRHALAVRHELSQRGVFSNADFQRAIIRVGHERP
jgi:hypothetical protein